MLVWVVIGAENPTIVEKCELLAAGGQRVGYEGAELVKIGASYVLTGTE